MKVITIIIPFLRFKQKAIEVKNPSSHSSGLEVQPYHLYNNRQIAQLLQTLGSSYAK